MKTRFTPNFITELKENENVYDPRKVIGSGQASMRKTIVDKINLFFNR